MPSLLGCVGLGFLLSRPAVATSDIDRSCDLTADGTVIEDDDDVTQASVALLQANISRLRSRSMQVEQESVFHLHIPKVAGSSFQIDAGLLLTGSGRGFRSYEGCFYNAAEGERVVSLLRSPHDHVVSMFRYCIFNRNFFNHGAEGYQDQIQSATVGGSSPTDWERDPEVMSEIFQGWLQAWVDLLDAGHATGFLPQSGTRPDGSTELVSFPSGPDVNCYSPVNLQTQRFQCTDRDVHPEPLSLDLAIENMQSLWVLGLQEEYATSMCLLHARALGELPPGCSCDSRDQLVLTMGNANDPTARPVISDEVRALLDRLTSQDTALYEAAVTRFHEDVAAVEAEFGVSILCSDDDDDDN